MKTFALILALTFAAVAPVSAQNIFNSAQTPISGTTAKSLSTTTTVTSTAGTYKEVAVRTEIGLGANDTINDHILLISVVGDGDTTLGSARILFTSTDPTVASLNDDADVNNAGLILEEGQGMFVRATDFIAILGLTAEAVTVQVFYVGRLTNSTAPS